MWMIHINYQKYGLVGYCKNLSQSTLTCVSEIVNQVSPLAQLQGLVVSSLVKVTLISVKSWDPTSNILSIRVNCLPRLSASLERKVRGTD